MLFHLPSDLLPSLLLGAYPALYLSVLAHECGHALIGPLCGFTITSFGLGTDRPFLQLRLPGRGPREQRTVLFLCRINPLQGLTWSYAADGMPPRPALLALLLGGALANLALAALALALWQRTHISLALVLGVVSAALGLSNLIPFAGRIASERRHGASVRSDGAQAIALFAPRAHRSAQAPAALLTFRSLWESLADQRMLAVQGYAACMAALDLGDAEAAQRFFGDARHHAEGLRDLLALAGADALAEAQLLAAVGNWAECIDHYMAARQAYTAAGGHGAALTAQILETIATAQRDGRNESALRTADDRLSHLGSHPLLRSYPALRTILLAQQIGLHTDAATQGTDLSRLETLLSRYESARYRCRMDTMDLHVYPRAAKILHTRGDLDGALPLYERALTAARAIYRTLEADPEAQDSFVRRLSATLLPDAEACLGALGRSSEATAARLLFPSPEEKERLRRLEAIRAEAEESLRQKREAYRLRLAGAVSAFNLVAGGVLVALAANGGDDSTSVSRFGGALLLGLPVTAVVWLYGRIARLTGGGYDTRPYEGSLALLFSLMVWFAGLLLLLLPSSLPQS